MNCFNIFKDICELLYYIVGIAGLITIYYTVQNNKSVKEERETIKKERQQIQLDKEKNEKERITNFLLVDYENFKKWKKSLESQNKLFSVSNINKYIKEKKLEDEYIEKVSNVIDEDIETEMRKIIMKLSEVSKIYIKYRNTSKIEEFDNCILDIFQTCIYECDKIKVFQIYEELSNLFIEINKEYANA